MVGNNYMKSNFILPSFNALMLQICLGYSFISWRNDITSFPDFIKILCKHSRINGVIFFIFTKMEIIKTLAGGYHVKNMTY
jgi:hypothetical protein